MKLPLPKYLGCHKWGARDPVRDCIQRRWESLGAAVPIQEEKEELQTRSQRHLLRTPDRYKERSHAMGKNLRILQQTHAIQRRTQWLFFFYISVGNTINAFKNERPCARPKDPKDIGSSAGPCHFNSIANITIWKRKVSGFEGDPSYDLDCTSTWMSVKHIKLTSLYCGP